MANDYLFRRFGDAEFDGQQSVTDSLYEAFDPGVDVVTALMSAAINYELNDHIDTYQSASPWGIAATGTSLADTLPVADSLYRQPTREILKQASIAFPLLAFYPDPETDATVDELASDEHRVTQPWRLDYIMAPMAPEDRRRVGAILRVIPKIVKLVERRRSHPAYSSGALQFGPDKGHFNSFFLRSYRIGEATFGEQGDGAVYPLVSMAVETTELEAPIVGAFADFEGVDISADVGGPEGLVPDLVEGTTQAIPDPAHPSSGPD